MAQGKRDRLSAEQRIEMWRRWKAGESLHEIGRAFGKDHGSIRFLLTQRGGIVPAARRRSPRTLTLAEREDISRGIASGSSIREIARGLAAGCVDGEPGGGASRRASTRIEPVKPIIRPGSRLCDPRRAFLPAHEKLRTIVASKLILDWSPEQISGWLKVQLSQQREHARVPRNHLPQLIHPGPRSAEKRADSAPAVQAAYPSLTARSGWRTVPRSDRRCHLHQRKACGD